MNAGEHVAEEHENPMWTGLSALAALAPDPMQVSAGDLACRIAVPSAVMRELIGEGVPAARVARFPTWDATHTLLADDDDLAELVRALGVPLPRPVSPYAVRQWDEREALDAALHRFHDHDERPWGVSAFDPRVGVVFALGSATVRALLTRLTDQGAASGLVVDAREAGDLRVFALEMLEPGRVIVVTREGARDLRDASEAAAALRALTAS